MSHLAPSGPQSVEHLPYPIAVAWQRVRHLTEPEQCVREALHCFDVTIRSLVALGCAQLQRERVLSLRAMLALTRPSLGHWVGALYEVAQALSASQEALTPQLLRWLDSAPLQLASGEKRTVRQIIDNLVTSRNRHAHSGTAFGSDLRILTDVGELIASLNWLRDYALIEIRNVATLPTGAFTATLVPWCGDRSAPPAHSMSYNGWLSEGSLGWFQLSTGRGVNTQPWLAIRSDRAGPATPHLMSHVDVGDGSVTLAEVGTVNQFTRALHVPEALPLHVGIEGARRLLLDGPSGAPPALDEPRFASRARTTLRRQWAVVPAISLLVAGLAFKFWPEAPNSTAPEPVAAVAPASHSVGFNTIAGEWEVDSRAFKGGKPTGIGARYTLTLIGDEANPSATLVRERYIRDGKFEATKEVGASGVVVLRPVEVGDRRWWSGRFVLQGPTGTEFVRAIAWTVFAERLVGVMRTGHEAVPTGLLVGDRRRPTDPAEEWSEVLANPDSFPHETRCVVAQTNLDCLLADHLLSVQKGQVR